MRLGLLLTAALCFGVGCNYEANCLLDCIDRVEISTTAPLPERYSADVSFGDTLLVADCSRREDGVYFDLNGSPDFECRADGVAFNSSAAEIHVVISASDGTVLAEDTLKPQYGSQETCGEECLLGEAVIDVTPTS